MYAVLALLLFGAPEPAAPPADPALLRAVESAGLLTLGELVPPPAAPRFALAPRREPAFGF